MITFKIEYKGESQMKQNTITAMMHPIRIRIIQELSIKKTATTKELQAACGNFAQATLYRHLKELLHHEIIKIESENTINGIIEKVYTINKDMTQDIAKDPSKLTEDDLTHIFNQFMIAIMTDYKTYIQHEDGLKNIQNEFGLVSTSLFLTDDELKELVISINQLIYPLLNLQQEPGRKLRKFSRIITTTK